MTIAEMWRSTRLSKKVFAELLGVPYQTVIYWMNNNTCPEYTAKLIEYYLQNEGYLKR